LKQIIRPRTLTVKRRHPSPVDLRVLKRFTFTEADSDFQWEKLRSAFTLAEWTEQYFNNRALFSDYYLNERLTDPRLTPVWVEDVRQIGRQVLKHLADARPRYSGQPERVIRKGLFEPLFTGLGFEFDMNKSGDSDLDEPDYVLYARGERDRPIVLAMTYVWNRNLDDMDPKRDTETPDEIPGALVVNVLARAETKWVIVTNGKLWRLYSTTADNKATNYYEIDLEEAVTAPENDQETALKYWWLFFRRQAFLGFLDDLWQHSADYAKGLGERLKERTFTAIFPHFAEGFIRQMRAEGEADPDLDAVFAATMTFLYRLMFILYAESLNLLPVTEERGYGAFSLYRLKKELAEAGGRVEEEAPERLGQHYRPDASALYEHLQLLFHAIDQGAQDLNLPLYNGGLFSDDTDEGRFLAEHAIPDRYLALGLDRLCRDVDDKTQALAAIDYKSLGVRQLGSIYEGLLEFKLRVAPEKLVVVKEKGKEVYLPARKAGKKRVVATLEKGDIYLENDKWERKATGSYYTPDYIVKYIVEHTVGPVLERKFEALEPRLREAQKLYRQHRRTVEARGNDHMPASSANWRVTSPAQSAPPSILSSSTRRRMSAWPSCGCWRRLGWSVPTGFSLPATWANASSNSPSPGKPWAWTSVGVPIRCASTIAPHTRFAGRPTVYWTPASQTWTAIRRTAGARFRSSTGRRPPSSPALPPQRSPRPRANGCGRGLTPA